VPSHPFAKSAKGWSIWLCPREDSAIFWAVTLHAALPRGVLVRAAPERHVQLGGIHARQEPNAFPAALQTQDEIPAPDETRGRPVLHASPAAVPGEIRSPGERAFQFEAPAQDAFHAAWGSMESSESLSAVPVPGETHG